MEIGMVFSLLILHWICDFILQTDEQAKGKSSSWSCLLRHTAIYSLMFTFCLFVLEGVSTENNLRHIVLLNCFTFMWITFILHTLTDYITSREVKKFFDVGNHHYGFIVIGLDQILHYIQIFLTYNYLFNG